MHLTFKREHRLHALCLDGAGAFTDGTTDEVIFGDKEQMRTHGNR
jgi:hypothetical protein